MCRVLDNFTIASAVYALFLRRSLEKAPDGVRLFCEPNIHIGCKRIVLFLRSMFKFLCHSQFLEMRATSKKVVLFHDNGFVLLRFGYVTKVHHI